MTQRVHLFTLYLLLVKMRDEREMAAAVDRGTGRSTTRQLDVNIGSRLF